MDNELRYMLVNLMEGQEVLRLGQENLRSGQDNLKFGQEGLAEEVGKSELKLMEKLYLSSRLYLTGMLQSLKSSQLFMIT